MSFVGQGYESICQRSLISPLGDIQPDLEQLTPTNADSGSAENYVYDAPLTLSDIGLHPANETLNQ